MDLKKQIQREIKFRAFDDGKMLSMPINSNYGISRFFGILREDAVIMQFTGMLDCDGKEIYEGDKVAYTLNHDGSQKEIKADVEWHNHAWRLNRIWLLTEIRNIKVVGDVF